MNTMKEYEEKMNHPQLFLDGGLTDEDTKRVIKSIFDIEEKKIYILPINLYSNLLPKKMLGSDIRDLLTTKSMNLKTQIQSQLLKIGTIYKPALRAEISIHELYSYMRDLTLNLGYKTDDSIIKDFQYDVSTKQKKEIEIALNNKKTRSFYYKLVEKGLFTLEELKEIIDTKLKNLISSLTKDEKHNNYFRESDEEKLRTLKKLLLDREKKIEVFDGPPGCGKSTEVVNRVVNFYHDKKIACITLSNLIGIEFVTKCLRKNDSLQINHFSNARANFMFSKLKNAKIKARLKKDDIAKQIENCDLIVIDEFSQWSLYELDLMIDIMNFNPNADVFIMGDKDQICTFLSNGSLLHSIKELLPSRVNLVHDKPSASKYNKNFRMKAELWDKVRDITNGKFNFKINTFDDIKNIKDIDCVITGSNANVNYCNLYMYYKKFDIDGEFHDFFTQYNITENDTFSEKLYKFRRLLEMTDGRELPLISNKNTKYAFNNEKFVLRIRNENYAELQSQVMNKQKPYILDLNDNTDFLTLFNDYDLGFSITVNRSQGLEWNKICVFISKIDKNLAFMNSLYVALSRSRDGVFVVSGGMKREEMMSYREIKSFVQKKYDFVNLFDFDYVYKRKSDRYYARVACIKKINRESKKGNVYTHVYVVFAYHFFGSILFVESQPIFLNVYNRLYKKHFESDNSYVIKISKNFVFGNKNYVDLETGLTLFNKESKAENDKKFFEILNRDNNNYIPHDLVHKINKNFVDETLLLNLFKIEE